MGNENSQQVKYADPLENDVEVQWQKTKVSNHGSFPGRDGHCACSVDNKLYVFGGVVHPEKNTEDITESNELLILDLESKEWSRAAVTGAIPRARSAATMVAVDNYLYLFGGLSRETGWFDTVHRFDTGSSTWSLVECQGTCPNPRDKLASAKIGDKIYIFGGFGPQGMEDDVEEVSDEDEEDEGGAQFGWFNDLFIFDTVTKAWSSPMQMNLGCPTPRAAHGMCSVGKYLVIFGGRDAEARQGDMHIFDTESRKWQKDVVVQGRQPDPRSFHTATTVGDRVVIFGGRGVSDQDFNDFHIFDTENRMWIQPKVQGSVPCGRGQHTATLVGDQLVVYGGSGCFSQETLQCTKYFNDIFTVKSDDITTGVARLPKGVATASAEPTAASPLNTDVQTLSSSEQLSDETDASAAKRPKLDDSEAQ